MRLLAGLAALALSLACAAQTFPVPGKPIRLVVPLPPGGLADIHARLIAARIGPALGTTAVVENKPGASTIIGTMEVVRAAPDGHTLTYGAAPTFAQNPHMFAKLPYDPFRDFTPVTLTAFATPVLTVHESIPARDVNELIAYARANPGRLSFGSFSAGSVSHLYGEMLKLQAGIDMLHVPYKGSADAMKDLLSGRVQLMFDSPTNAIANVKTGKVRAIGVTGEQRVPVLPEVPTMAEQGIRDMESSGWFAVLGPAGMAPDTARRLHSAIAAALRSPEIEENFFQGGVRLAALPPEEFAAVMRRHYDYWGALIRRLNLRLD